MMDGQIGVDRGEIGMKIIQEKQPYKEWSLEVCCTGRNWDQGDLVPCGSLLEMDKNDLLIRTSHRYGSEEETDYGFVCPVCGCFSELDKGVIDKHLEKLATPYRK